MGYRHLKSLASFPKGLTACQGAQNMPEETALRHHGHLICEQHPAPPNPPDNSAHLVSSTQILQPLVLPQVCGQGTNSETGAPAHALLLPAFFSHLLSCPHPSTFLALFLSFPQRKCLTHDNTFWSTRQFYNCPDTWAWEPREDSVFQSSSGLTSMCPWAHKSQLRIPTSQNCWED